MLKLVAKGIRKISKSMFSTADNLENRHLISLIHLLHGERIHYDGEKWAIHNMITGKDLSFPHYSDRIRHEQKYRDRLNECYFTSEFVKLEEEDVVFDIGAYIGVTSIIAAEKAKKVYAIEPSPRARNCLEYNTRHHDNIEVLPYAVWDKSEKIELKYGLKSSEDGLIDPDDGGNGQSVTVQAHSIATIADIVNVDQIDFLKVEAEGVEPEIVDGIGNTRIKKIASTGNAERYGESTHQEVSDKLQSQGYDVDTNLEHSYQMVYAKKL